MKLSKYHAVAGVLAAASLWLSGCLSQSSGPSAVEAHASDSATAAANAQADDIFQQLSSPDFQYGHEDLGTLRNANASFQQGLKLNPDNNQARLGASITSVLLAFQSKRLSDLINGASLAKSPLSGDLTRGAGLARAAILSRVAAESRPEVHALQDAVADTLLPVLEAAIAQMQAVYNDPGFSMKITVDGEVRELDHGEVTVLLAGFKTLHALSTLALAYDLDFDDNGSYDYLDTLDDIDFGDFDNRTPQQTAALNTLTGLFASSSSFLAVRPAWKDRLANVDNEISDALDVLKAGLATIPNETDDQSDDILKICAGQGVQSDCIDRADFDDGLASLDTLRKYMNHPYPTAFGDTTVAVNYASFFNVQDYKKMFPRYAFYSAAQWSTAKPVLYFTNASGAETGNLKTVSDLEDRAYDDYWTNAKFIDSLQVMIHWTDPTFQGFLPGTTEPRLWRLILLGLNQDGTYFGGGDADYKKAAGKAVARKRPDLFKPSVLLDPRFPLRLIGK